MFRADVNDEARFSRLVGAIYDCALEPQRWRETLASLASFLRSAGSSVIINDNRDTRAGHIFEHGIDQKYLRLFFERHAADDMRDPAQQRASLGSPKTLMLLCREQPKAREFFENYVGSQGLGDSLAVQILQSGRRVGWLSMARTGIQPAFGHGERALMQLLSPHLCQAMALSDSLELATLTASNLERTIDALSVGVFFTDGAGQVVHLNRSAQRILANGNGVRLVRNRLVATDRTANALLARALAACDYREIAPVPAGTILTLSEGAGHGYLASVLPLTGGIRRDLMAPFRARAGVFVQDPLAAARTSGQAVAQIYGLTEAELNVLLALVPGLSVKEVGRALGLREPTVKTHLQRIFLKTGMSRQSELIRLLVAHAPPLRPVR